MKNVRLAPVAAGFVLCLLAHGAIAQYVWIDEKGVKQFSDMPPPVGVPANRILKQPGRTERATAPETTRQPTDTEAKSFASQPKSAAEQNADFKKRQAEQAEKDRKAAAQAKNEAEKTSYCESTRSYLRNLESGVRIASTDANGERAYMTDEQREHAVTEARRRLADCK